MDKKSTLFLRLEGVWWLFTLVVALGTLFPILKEIDNYPFLLINCIFVIVFITFTRYIFLLRYTFLAERQYIKAGIILTIIPVIFYLISQVNYFQTYIDEIGLGHLMEDLSLKKQQHLSKYIQSELLFFGVGSVLSAILLPFRLLLSIWRMFKDGQK